MVNAGDKNTSSMHHPRRRNVTTSMVGLKKKKGHIRPNLAQNGEPIDIAVDAEEEEWSTREIELGTHEKKKNDEPQRYSWGTKKKNNNGKPQRYSWGTQKMKNNGEPQRYSWGTQKKIKNGETQRYSWGTQKKRIMVNPEI